MNLLANQTEKVGTESDLSGFVGATVIAPPAVEPAFRSLTDTVESDHLDWTDRLFSLDENAGFPDGFSISPSLSGSNYIYPLNKLFTENTILLAAQHRYFGYCYDSIDVRVSLSEPKNLVGGTWIGWWPYQDFFDKNAEETFQEYIADSDGINFQTWINSPYTHFLPFGMSAETAFTIPWTYKFPFLETRANTFYGQTPSTRPTYGTPCIWFNIAAESAFVNSTTNAAKVHIFIKFKNLRFYGPGNYPHEEALAIHKARTPILRKIVEAKAARDLAASKKKSKYTDQCAHGPDCVLLKRANTAKERAHLIQKANYEQRILSQRSKFVDQSGLEAMAMAEVASVAASALGVTNMIDSLTSPFSSEKDVQELSKFGTYDDPQAVQLAFVGDTISCDFPSVTPIFSPHMNMEQHPIPSIHQMLKRPQFLFVTNSEKPEKALVNDPMRFDTGTAYLGNYFRFFGMLHRYWRGTVNFHFLIASHPLVQCQFRAVITYPGDLTLAANTSRSACVDQHLTVFNGTKMITVPMPYCTTKDYMPVNDAYPSDPPISGSYTTVCNFKLTVISTMLDIQPTIPVYVFVSAADDFCFYGPIPPGLYNADELEPAPLKVGLEDGWTPGGYIAGEKALVEKNKKKGKFVDQVHLPTPEQEEVMRSRYGMTNDPGTMPVLPNLIDFMKIWCRCVPFEDYDNDDDEEPIPDASAGFVYPYWYPPIDRTADVDVNNSWYFTLDYIAILSTLFLYYRGDMAFKIVIAGDHRPQTGYVYVSLGDPVGRQKTHVPFPYTSAQIPPQSNFGAGTVITPLEKQPVLEVSIPYRGSNVWSYANANACLRPPAVSLDYTPNAAVNHNVVLQGTADYLADAMFRKVGPNFNLAVETTLPPATMWAARGFDWSS